MRAAVLTAALTAAVAGCGAEKTKKPIVEPLTPASQVRVIVESFGRASTNKDYAIICQRLLATQLSDKVEQLGLPCEKALKKGLGAVKDPQLSIDGITVQGKTAYAKIHTTATGQKPLDAILRLQLIKAQWRIVSLDDESTAARKAGIFKLF